MKRICLLQLKNLQCDHLGQRETDNMEQMMKASQSPTQIKYFIESYLGF
jgi:hypothetical protein